MAYNFAIKRHNGCKFALVQDLINGKYYKPLKT